VWDKVKLFDPEQAQRNGEVYPIPTTYTLTNVYQPVNILLYEVIE